MTTGRTTTLTLITALSTLAACGSKKDGQGTATATAAGTGATTASGSATASGAGAATAATVEPPKIDADYQAVLDKVLASCEVNTDGATVGCKNREDDGFYDLWNDRKKAKTDALDVLAVWLADADPKKQTIAANVMHSKFGTLAPNPGPVTTSTSGRLIEATRRLPQYQANQAGAAVVHAAMLAGDQRIWDLFANPPHPSFRGKYEHLMQHGRVAPLDKMKELAKSAPPRELAALVRAPRSMYDATAEEKAAVCPWVKDFLAHAETAVAYEAAFTMGWCGGEHVDAMIADGERRLAEGSLTNDVASAYREPCAQFISKERTPEQTATCEKVYAFLEKIGADPKASGEVRGRALWNIYYQERTQATYDRLKKYAKDKDPEVREQVADAMKSLKESYGAK